MEIPLVTEPMATLIVEGTCVEWTMVVVGVAVVGSVSGDPIAWTLTRNIV